MGYFILEVLVIQLIGWLMTMRRTTENDNRILSFCCFILIYYIFFTFNVDQLQMVSTYEAPSLT
jgi:hypothetical protein